MVCSLPDDELKSMMKTIPRAMLASNAGRRSKLSCLRQLSFASAKKIDRLTMFGMDSKRSCTAFESYGEETRREHCLHELGCRLGPDQPC